MGVHQFGLEQRSTGPLVQKRDFSGDGPTQYLLGALVLKLETSCSTRDLPHLGHFGGRFFRRSCSLIGTLTSKCLPHALHSNS